MTARMGIAGLVGGVVVFLVTGFFHMATNLGEYGIKTLPNEESALTMMRTSIPESGLYLFPGADMSNRSAASQAAFLEKYKAGPVGILSYERVGGEFSFGRLLLNQFLLILVAALFLAWILGITAGATTYASRMLIVFAASLFAGFVYALPYWNWYRFPLSYTIAYIATWSISWVVAGFAMAAIVKPRPAAA